MPENNDLVTVVAEDARDQSATKTAPNGKPLDEFLRTATRRFQLAKDAEDDNRKESLDDLKFYEGDQWPAAIAADRAATGRPCLTINRIKPVTKLVLNEQRQARPAIQVNPVGGGEDVETAQVKQGLIRHIEINSDADIAYDTAFQHMTICGFGYIRVLTDFQDPLSFDQEILIERVLNQFSVYFDPNCRKQDYSDATYAFVVSDLDKDVFKEQYPKSELVGLDDFRGTGDAEREWFSNGKIRVAEYFFVEKEKATVVAIVDQASPEGYQVVREDQLPEGAEIMLRNGLPITREAEFPKVYWVKMNAREILEEAEWPGQWIPIVPVLGDELIIDGKRCLSGLVRNAKDPQRRLNYETSAMTEAIALAPKAPWVAAVGQIEGYEDLYAQANVKNLVVLPYIPKSVEGQLVPPPMRQHVEPAIQAIVMARSAAEADLKGTTGIYDAYQGARGPEQSGKAILARQSQGNVVNFDFTDNLRRAMKHLGEILLDLIPKIYDRPGRVVDIVRPDGKRKKTILNQQFDEGGQPRIYDLSKGRNAVTVSTGPTYQSHRQQFVESVMNLVQAVPQMWQFIGDLVVRHFDWPGADEIAERLKKMLPPNLQEAEDGQKQPIPPEVQAKIEALMQQHAALVEQLNAATNSIETKELELRSKEKIADIQAQTQLVVAEMKVSAQNGQALLMAELQSIHKRLDLADKQAEREAVASAPTQPTEPQVA